MPLDGHQYLVSQGWRGKGTGLRDGALARPLTIPQKKNLAGLGKDRDEAFPFWDHLFTAAAISIKLKCPSDSEEESNVDKSFCIQDPIRRTTTGILSNRRPLEGAPATSDPPTPGADSALANQRFNILVAAKRRAAKQSLYSMFFKGPILGSGNEASVSCDPTQIEESPLNLEAYGAIDSKVIQIVKEGRASKRKRRDLDGKDGRGLKRRKRKAISEDK